MLWTTRFKSFGNVLDKDDKGFAYGSGGSS